jgi:hypothetical protein
LEAFREQLAGEGGTALQPIAHAAEQLYERCAEALGEQADMAFVKEQLADVILSLGFPLKQLAESPEEPRVIAGFREGLGLEFHIDRQHGVHAEVVALSEPGAVVYPDTIDEGMAVAHEVMLSLKDRQCRVRERFRKLHKHPEGHRLRVVNVMDQDAGSEFTAAIVAPKAMGME